MSGEDEFERRLQSHPQPKLPATWRAEILSAAKAAASGQAVAEERSPAKSPVSSWLTGWLWPSPRAWAGLAAAWLVVLALDLASREPSPGEWARRAAPVSAESREMLREQGELLAELVGPRHSAEAIKPALAQPRSQRREQSATA